MKRILTTLVMATAIVSMGCAQTALDENWGESVAEYRAAMIVDPNAGSTDPILGVDPLTGEIIIETYVTQERNKEESADRLFLVTE